MSELKQPEQKKTTWRFYIPAMVLMYMDIQKADKNEIKKFGDAYRYYLDRFPQINFILGIIRKFQNRRKNR